MPVQSLGKITVTTAGTPVQINSTNIPCQAISIQALSSNAGKVYVGLSGMSKTTLIGNLAVLAVPSGAIIPSFSASVDSANGLNVSQYWIDVDNSGEGVLVAYSQT